MKALIWFLIVGLLGGMGWALARWRRQWALRQAAAEARLASFIAQANPTPAAAATGAAPAPPVVPSPAPQERLLLDAAAKAGEAGEPVLSIQLYAKLLSRYPHSQFASQARTAVQVQKKKLAKA